MNTEHRKEVKETCFKLNPGTRALITDTVGKCLVAGDRDSERFRFLFPRYIGGEDLLTADRVEIHYSNISTDEIYASNDVYECTDLMPVGEDEISFTWLLSANAAKYPGTLQFLCKLKRLDGENNVVYTYQSDIYGRIAVRESKSNSATVAEQLPDVLATWRAEIMAEMEGADIPAYLEEEADRVALAVQAERNAKTLVFPVLSDLHLFAGNAERGDSLVAAQYAGMGVRALQKRLPLDFVALLGDYSRIDGAGSTAAQVKEDMALARQVLDLGSLQTVWCVGEQEANREAGCERPLESDELYAYLGAATAGVKPFGESDRGYGYLDFPDQRIRVIYLNTCDGKDLPAGVATTAWVSPTQLKWLADTALDLQGAEEPGTWGIVLLSHHPLHHTAACFGQAMQILEAYRSGESGTLVCIKQPAAGNSGAVTERVPYNFTAGERAEIICNIHGHDHNCGASKISSVTRQGGNSIAPWLWRLCIPNVCAEHNNGAATAADARERESFGEFDENGAPVYWPKERGNAKATGFCVVSIDRKEEMARAHIFGAGKDRVIQYLPGGYTFTILSDDRAGDWELYINGELQENHVGTWENVRTVRGVGTGDTIFLYTDKEWAVTDFEIKLIEDVTISHTDH